MKKSFLTSRLAVAAGAAILAAGTVSAHHHDGHDVGDDSRPDVHHFTLDAAHSWVTFEIKRLPGTNARGMFQRVSGEIHFHPDNLEDSKVVVEVQVNSVNTGVEARDNHLRNEDFFHVEEFPLARFESSSITHKEGDVYEITGTFTMMGVEKELTTDFTYFGIAEDSRGTTRVGGEATFTVDRSEFGQTYGLATIDSTATVTVSLEGVVRGNR